MRLDKVFHIAKREFLIKIRRPSFLVFLFFGPIIMLTMMIVPIGLTIDKKEFKKVNIIVSDQNNKYPTLFSDTRKYEFAYTNNSPEVVKVLIDNNAMDGGVIVYQDGFKVITKGSEVDGNDLEQHIKSQLINHIHQYKFEQEYLSFENVSIQNDTRVALVLFLTSLIFMFIFTYSFQVMRSILAEKSTKIIEVLLTSCKPIEIMLGKITGALTLSLVQFSFWMTSSSIIYNFVSSYLGVNSIYKKIDTSKLTSVNLKHYTDILNIQTALSNIDWIGLSVLFFTLFISGFLIYASIFAGIAARSDKEENTQQYTLPIMLPLVIAFLSFESLITNSHSFFSQFLMYFPLTTPITTLISYINNPNGLIVIYGTLISVLSAVLSLFISSRVYHRNILPKIGKKRALIN